MHNICDAPVAGIEHIMQPYKFNLGFDETEEAFCNRAVQELEDKINAIGAEKIAAFVAEPIQGAGGVIIPPAGYWKKIEAVCKKHGILLAVSYTHLDVYKRQISFWITVINFLMFIFLSYFSLFPRKIDVKP